MSTYGWIITKDHLAEHFEESEAGVMGPNGISPAIEQRLKSGEGEPFRLLDDDGEVYYTGLQIGGSGEEPLLDFGAPNAGCTMLQQRVNGKWEITIG